MPLLQTASFLQESEREFWANRPPRADVDRVLVPSGVFYVFYTLIEGVANSALQIEGRLVANDNMCESRFERLQAHARVLFSTEWNTVKPKYNFAVLAFSDMHNFALISESAGGATIDGQGS